MNLVAGSGWDVATSHQDPRLFSLPHEPSIRFTVPTMDTHSPQEHCLQVLSRKHMVPARDIRSSLRR